MSDDVLANLTANRVRLRAVPGEAVEIHIDTQLAPDGQSMAVGVRWERGVSIQGLLSAAACLVSHITELATALAEGVEEAPPLGVTPWWAEYPPVLSEISTTLLAMAGQARLEREPETPVVIRSRPCVDLDASAEVPEHEDFVIPPSKN
jgi:hypothetical protein